MGDALRGVVTGNLDDRLVTACVSASVDPPLHEFLGYETGLLGAARFDGFLERSLSGEPPEPHQLVAELASLGGDARRELAPRLASALGQLLAELGALTAQDRRRLVLDRVSTQKHTSERLTALRDALSTLFTIAPIAPKANAIGPSDQKSRANRAICFLGTWPRIYFDKRRSCRVM